MAERGLRLLVKARPTQGTVALALGARPVSLRFEPLLPQIEARRPGALAATAAPVWHVASAPGAGDVSPWDACHALLDGGLGVQARVEIAEPDLEQQWIPSSPAKQALALAKSCDLPEPQDADVYATASPNTWFRDTAYSQLAAAQQAVGTPAAGDRIRIAHLDTGYDPAHASRPALLRTDLQRNFVDDAMPDDASDGSGDALLASYGHGTGTLGILAGTLPGGGPLGAAAALEIVPLRVANRVVLFRNSAIASAFDYVFGLWSDPATRVHVVTMSMGGLASAAWADAVNALYERGVFVVTAAGNNYGHVPTRFIVHPARFRRVVAACGVMADGRPYADLPPRKMAGCYGPASKNATAIAAFTPNVPWPRIGCASTVDWDGNGTSSATPQVASAAALWLQRHRAAVDAYPQGWMRVEAVRKALFESARAVDPARAERLGRGILQANDMLGVKPAAAAALAKQDEDSASFGLFELLTGLGVAAAPSPRERMLELEALQISQRSHAVESLLGGRDPSDPAFLSTADVRRVLEAIADEPGASRALRSAIAHRLDALSRPPGTAPPAPVPTAPLVAPAAPAPAPRPAPSALAPALPRPGVRPLRIYAFDPLMATRPDTAHLNEAIVPVRWEAPLGPGPTGEYLEVVDVDPPSSSAYAPVDLDAPELLAQSGFPPTEGHPQFHQQMVYAVAMKTIEHFERALGRVALWAPRFSRQAGQAESRFVRRLRIYPHALREANAFYSPERVALLFGYFNASQLEAGDNLPGGLVFTCLSHDVVAHETTHALLDGLHPHYKDRTGLDMLAFHEAFADLVALFQHFTLPEALRDAIAKTRGDLGVASLLAGLAVQFGQAIGNREALRSAIAGRDPETGEWAPLRPDRGDYERSAEPHERGAVLVAAVFDAFLQIYRLRTADLFRLASGGTGVLPAGRIPHDLVERLAREAAEVASEVLLVCIRALDYCPPVDLSFGEYLRALVTVDRDLLPQDDRGHRASFIDAFRRRGIFPADVTNLSVDTLAWQRPDLDVGGLAGALHRLSSSWSLRANRLDAFLASNADAQRLYDTLVGGRAEASTLAALGLVKTGRRPERATLEGTTGIVSPIELHSVRPARRIGPDGEVLEDVVIEVVQKWTPAGASEPVRGGSTLVCDRRTGEPRYVIRKRVGHRERVAAQLAFTESQTFGSRERNYFDARERRAEPFALLHRES